MSNRLTPTAEGIKAFCALLDHITALPDLLLPGRKAGDDDSMGFDYTGAEQLLRSTLDAHAQSPGFSRAMAAFMLPTMKGLVIRSLTPARVQAAFGRVAGARPAEAGEEHAQPRGWRETFAWEAASEVTAIGQALQRQCPELDGDLVRGLAIRLEHLGCIVMSTQDDDEKEGLIAYRLFGAAGAVKRAEAAGNGGAA